MKRQSVSYVINVRGLTFSHLQSFTASTRCYKLQVKHMLIRCPNAPTLSGRVLSKDCCAVLMLFSLAVLLEMLQLGCTHDARYYLDKGTRFYAEGKYADASIAYRNSI